MHFQKTVDGEAGVGLQFFRVVGNANAEQGPHQILPQQHAHHHFGTALRRRTVDQAGLIQGCQPVLQPLQGGFGALGVDVLEQRPQQVGGGTDEAQELQIVGADEEFQYRQAEPVQRIAYFLKTGQRQWQKGGKDFCLGPDDGADQGFAVAVAGIDGDLGNPGSPRHRLDGDGSRPLLEQQLAGGCQNGLILLLVGRATQWLRGQPCHDNCTPPFINK